MKSLISLLFLSSLAFGQASNAVRWDLGGPIAGVATVASPPAGNGAVSNYLVTVAPVSLNWCSYPANSTQGNPCTNYAQTYTDLTLTTNCPNTKPITLQGSNICQSTSDSLGNIGVNAEAGIYTYTLTIGSTTYGPFVVSLGGSGGGSGLPNGLTTFTNQTSVSLPNPFASIAVIPVCADASGNQIFPYNVNTQTSAVAVTFSFPQSGVCVLNGSGGGSGTSILPTNNVFTGNNTLSSTNGILNPTVCTATSPPSWCSTAPSNDILGWTQAAITQLGCGEVAIPAGTYTVTSTTQVLVPRCVNLHGASGNGTVINVTNTWPFIIADPHSGTQFPEGGIHDLTLGGPGAGTSTGGIYIGGSDGQSGSPSTAVDPNSNFADHINIQNIFMASFGTCIQFGNNAYNDTISQSYISSCGLGINFPANSYITNSGENISLINSTVAGGSGIGIRLGSNNSMDFHCVNSSIDANASWAVQTSAGQFTMDGCHIEQPSNWIQSFGPTTLVNSILTNGLNSGTLGYLIDNEASSFAVFGGTWNNGGSATQYFNPAGLSTPVLVGVILNCCSVPPAKVGNYIDNSGNAWLGNQLLVGAAFGTTTVGGNPCTVPGATFTMGWNFTGGLAEADFCNLYHSGGGTATAYQWYGLNTGGTPSLLMSLLWNGLNVGAPPAGCTFALGNGASMCGVNAIATGVSTNTDGAGHLTMSSGTATYSFVGTYTVAPSCVASDETAIAAVKVAPTTSSVVFTTAGASDVISYQCTILD